ncbi:hypothetical protein Y032_0084g1733 [Ancylostoma ceylanicum]|uniref:Uncharacterized protein n=1 Tax=Ancylostoma ceylanicum TaxID=53326 RepID=A0A016TRJ0_9BILA|nr:hypothetical protein Y032_0084g1733 [Ancylostoma ceylanicum]
MQLLLLVAVLAAATRAQLYPTLIQSRPVYLPSNLPPHLQLAGAVPVYEPAYQSPPPQVIGTSVAPQPLVVQPVPAPMVSSVGPQLVQTAAPQPLLQAMPLQQQYPYGYGYGYPTQKPDGPLKRFFKGAADGFVLGTMGWLG